MNYIDECRHIIAKSIIEIIYNYLFNANENEIFLYSELDLAIEHFDENFNMKIQSKVVLSAVLD